MRSVGIDRISMGVQSFDDAELRRSARSHSAEQAKTAAREIRRAGFEDFNLDLITALPGQEIETLEHSVSTAIELDPPHVSIYSYRPDPRTTLAKQSAAGHRERVDRNKMLGFYGRAKELLEAAGYAEYMTSYFAKEPEHRFKGETYYFELQGDYIGFGSGAYSLLGHRYFRNSSDLHSFIDNPFEIESCELFNTGGPYDTLAILIGSALLTSAGLNFARFERIAGFGFSEICDQPAIKRLIEYYADCGAVFEETNDALLVVPETRTQAYITHMSGMYEVSWLRRGL
jgi:oxygen-independent coproporphyrinogen-3 oxidase